MLQKLFRSSDVIGRFGGDEFVVLAKGMASLDGVERKCCRLREQMASFRVDGAKDGVTCSVGAVVVDNQAADYNSLFRQADAALYEAKKNGKNTHVIADTRAVRPQSEGAAKRTRASAVRRNRN